MTNVRKSKWTLRLLTQSGECRITEIADMNGIGTVWLCGDGVANILSQHRMAVCSKWQIYYNADEFESSGDPQDLCYHVITPQGRRH